MVKADQQIAELGVLVHAALVTLHMLGLVYNARRKNWFDVASHGAAVAYDSYAVVKHLKQLDDLEEEAGLWV